MSMIQPAGWCAPSDQVYDFLANIGDAPLDPACPEWNEPEAPWCQVHEVWTNEIYGRAWHSCKDEFNGPHKVCVCEDCGAQRVVL